MRHRVRDEAGVVGGFEVLPFGFLVFVAGSLLLVNAWAVVDANLAASAAAREAVRAVVEGGVPADGAEAAAVALAGQGKDPERMTLRFDGGGVRCAPLTATVTYEVPTFLVPWIGLFGGPLRTTAHHTEVVDPYRGGSEVDGFVPEACSG